MKNYSRHFAIGSLFFAISSAPSPACELCAVYSADNARTGDGFSFTVAEQYLSAHDLQVEGETFSSLPFLNQAYLDSSLTHLVPGYNFSSWFGISVNVPIVHRDFRRTEFLTTGGIVDEEGSVSGLGDVALIGRVSLVRKIAMTHAITVNLLAGIKFPTGDTERLDAEIDDAKLDRAIFGRNHPHGSIGGVHEHDLSLGSGSYDGVFGLTSNLRWKRWFFNNQIQYYLRTEAHSYQFGDLIIVSGGPGAYVLLTENYTLSLQANAFYESSSRDEMLDQTFSQTGTTAWYMGPLLNFTYGEHFSANVGVDLPLRIYNNGLQTVPDYRIHGGLTWRF